MRLNEDELQFAAPCGHEYFPPPAMEFFHSAKRVCPKLFAWTILNYSDDKATFFSLMAIVFTHYRLEISTSLMWGWALKTSSPTQRRVLVAAQDLLYSHSISTPNDRYFLMTPQEWSRILYRSPIRYWARYCHFLLVQLRKGATRWHAGKVCGTMLPCAQCGSIPAKYCQFCWGRLCKRCQTQNLTLVNPQDKCAQWAHHDPLY